MLRSRQLAALGLLAIASALASCGGSGGTPVTADELVAKGDAICAEGFDRFDAIQAETATTVSEYADQTGKLADSAQTELDALKDLEPPPAVAPKYDAYLAAKQRGVDLLKDGQKAAEQQDGNRFGKLQQEVEKTASTRRKLAQAVGFKVCSHPPAGSKPSAG
jgi:hypothetical protein